MESLKQDYSHYYSSGKPFVKTIKFPTDTIILTGTVTVGTTVYDIATDLIIRDNRNSNELALALADAINGHAAKLNSTHKIHIPNGLAYARILDDGTLLIFGRCPDDNFILSSTIPGTTILINTTGTGAPPSPVTPQGASGAGPGPFTLAGTPNFDVNIVGLRLIHHVFTFDIALTTDATVVIGGKANNTDPSFAQASDNVTIITTAGRGMVKIANTPLEHVQLVLLAETGGVATIINVEYRGSS